eukprot:scaffold3084_cov144-Cylindrotheca_fusiformis.AAC.70
MTPSFRAACITNIQPDKSPRALPAWAKLEKESAEADRLAAEKKRSNKGRRSKYLFPLLERRYR